MAVFLLWKYVFSVLIVTYTRHGLTKYEGVAVVVTGATVLKIKLITPITFAHLLDLQVNLSPHR